MYYNLTHSHTMTPFDGSWKKAFENIVRKGEIACTSNFSFSYIVFYSIKGIIIIFVTFYLSSANDFSFVWSKILLCGNALSQFIRCYSSSSYKRIRTTFTDTLHSLKVFFV